MTSRLKVLTYYLNILGGKVQDGNMYVLNAHFGSSFCCLISQFSHSRIPQIRNQFQTKFTDPAKRQSSKFTEQMDRAVKSSILKIHQPCKKTSSQFTDQMHHVVKSSILSSSKTFSWYEKGHIPLPKWSSHIPPPHSTDPLLLRTR